jgi:hypothetical protein
MKITLLYFLFALLPAFASAQGLRVDETRHNALPRQPLYGDGGKAEAEELAGIRKIDLKPYCPKPRSQGQVASCTGWAAGYAALTIANAAAKGWDDPRSVTDSAFSALFLYNQVRENFEDCTEGSFIDQALKLISMPMRAPAKNCPPIRKWRKPAVTASRTGWRCLPPTTPPASRSTKPN